MVSDDASLLPQYVTAFTSMKSGSPTAIKRA
jgi:hypothetical protein